MALSRRWLRPRMRLSPDVRLNASKSSESGGKFGLGEPGDEREFREEASERREELGDRLSAIG